MGNIKKFTALLLLGTAPVAVHAQTAPQTEDQGDTGAVTDSGADLPTGTESDIVVTAERERGAVIGDIKPEQTLDQGDIRAYGASTISELLDALSPQTSSGRGRSSGRPVLLLNGQRISDFRELRDLPTEAIERVEILPEEVALKYGYRADQRVVNIVLLERFNAWTVDLDDTLPTEGGTNDGEAESNYLRIRNGGRLNVNLEYENKSRLLESERGITASDPTHPYDIFGNVTALGDTGDDIDAALPVSVAGAPVTSGIASIGDFSTTANSTDTTPYRTLQAASQRFEVNTIYSKRIGDVSATGNINIEQENTQSYNGLAEVGLTLPADNPYSPFSNDVSLYRYAGTDPLTQDTHTLTAHGGFTLNGALSGWQWSVTGNLDREQVNTWTQTGVDTDAVQAALLAGDSSVNPFAPEFLNGDLYRPTDSAKSVSTSEEVNVLFTGTPLTLPAGEVNTSVKLGFTNSDYDSRSRSSGILQTSDIGRSQADGQINIDVPIADADRGVLPILGHVSLNGNAQVQQLSDFGTLTSIGYGLNWEPIDDVRLLVSITDEDGAPTAAQLGGAVITTPNSRIFDYVTGETVDITRISGGNPDLVADNRHVMKIGLNAKPLSDPDLRLSVEYVKERIDNPIASFPSVTAAIQEAFPDRFVRDAAGDLVQVDARPVNFLRSDRQQIRWGFDFNKRLGGSASDGGGGGPPGGGGPGGGPPGGGGPGGPGGPGGGPPPGDDGGPPPGELADSSNSDSSQSGQQQSDQTQSANAKGEQDGQQSGNQSEGRQASSGSGNRRSGGRGPFGHHDGGRLMFSVYHTIHLQDRVLIRDGVPELDLLNGSATGNSGGQPRHEVELRAGAFKNGFGVRFSGDWQSGTDVDSGTSGDESLHFSSLMTFDLRLFADLGNRDNWVKAHPWLHGVRVSFDVDNIFNERQRVTDSDGTVPISYQPAYLDALGRTVKISVRKLFY
ncbi:TonB-dependent receptor [Stakelama sp. CBK3Z-3]|uniref:TonB-dependent receptor n=1 Tax=Stakelama flava TaxID=2860338 RepID=A0ABS6XP40_9SPHN|nr:TonB-dependent receptor [Stakelama flava]MBW4331989.1 TonB-dependent receptor [Stakelama flava]